LNVGLYDFMAIPGVKIPEGTIKEPDTDKEMKEKPMDLIVEGGIIKGEVVTIKRGPDVKEIKSLYILPEYQKQGLGKKVVAAMFMNPKTKRIVGVSAAKSDPYWEKLSGGQKPMDIDLDKEQQEEIMRSIRPMLLEAGYNPLDISYENLHPSMKKTFPIGASFEIRKEEFSEKYPTALITKEKPSIEEEKIVSKIFAKELEEVIPPTSSEARIQNVLEQEREIYPAGSKEDKFNITKRREQIMEEMGIGKEIPKITAAKRFGLKTISKLKVLGQGADRKVYALDKNKVLKVATNLRGLRQNAYEETLWKEGQIKHYETGKDYVVMERVQPAGENVMKLREELTKAQEKDKYINLIGITKSQKELLVEKGYPKTNYSSDILKQAKVNDISKLLGIPVEVEFEFNTLTNWRILEEVL